MSKPKLTDWDFCEAAKKLKCEVAAIKAVANVESRGDGFYDNGFPTILFERHKFRKFTRGKYNESHPHLSGPQGGYGKAGQNQQNKFSEAFALDPEAAMEACSWGKFQVMGFNWEDLGYESIHEFVDLMKTGEAAHLDSFVRFVIKNGLADELRRKDFTTFARVYNGPGYRDNKYDTKMEADYKKFSRANIDCSTVKKSSLTSAVVSSSQSALPSLSENNKDTLSPDPQQEQPPSETPIVQQAEQIINTGDVSSQPAPEDKTLTAPTKDGATASSTKMTIAGIVVPGFVVTLISTIKQWVADGYLDARQIGDTILGFIAQNQKYVFILIGAIIVLLIVKKIVKQITFWIEMITKAVPSFNNITVVPADAPPPSKWWQIWK